MRNVMLGLLIFVALDQPAPQALKERLDSIRNAQTEASRQYQNVLAEAKTEEQRKEVIEVFLSKVVVNSDRALDLARQHPYDPISLDALVFVIKTAGTGPSDRSEKAIEIMAHDHVMDNRMGDVCQQIFHFFHLPAAERLIRTVLDQNPSRTARGLACHSLAKYLNNQAHIVRMLRDNPVWLPNFRALTR